MIKKHLLDKASSVSLMLGFMVAATGFMGRVSAQQKDPPRPAPQSDTLRPKQDLPPGHTYWKVRTEEKDANGRKIYNTYDGAIIDIWRCPERGICAALHSVDPHDEKMHKLAAKVLKKKIGDVTDEDVLQFCGYQADLENMEEKRPGPGTGPLGKWSGTVDIRIKGLPGQTDPNGTKVAFVSKLHINIEEIGEILVHAQAYKGIPLLGGAADLIPVTDPPVGCLAPPAVKQLSPTGPANP
jgi:hypothetical protein